MPPLRRSRQGIEQILQRDKASRLNVANSSTSDHERGRAGLLTPDSAALVPPRSTPAVGHWQEKSPARHRGCPRRADQWKNAARRTLTLQRRKIRACRPRTRQCPDPIVPGHETMVMPRNAQTATANKKVRNLLRLTERNHCLQDFK